MVPARLILGIAKLLVWLVFLVETSSVQSESASDSIWNPKVRDNSCAANVARNANFLSTDWSFCSSTSERICIAVEGCETEFGRTRQRRPPSVVRRAKHLDASLSECNHLSLLTITSGNR